MYRCVWGWRKKTLKIGLLRCITMLFCANYKSFKFDFRLLSKINIHLWSIMLIWESEYSTDSRSFSQDSCWSVFLFAWETGDTEWYCRQSAYWPPEPPHSFLVGKSVAKYPTIGNVPAHTVIATLRGCFTLAPCLVSWSTNHDPLLLQEHLEQGCQLCHYDH